MRIKAYVVLLILAMWGMSVQAQSLWTSVEVSTRIAEGLNVFGEGEFRTYDGMSSTERWSGSVGLAYRPLPNVNLRGGYTYMQQQTKEKATRSGGIVPPFWQSKHRGFFAVSTSYSWNRLIFTWRERYQYTYRMKRHAPKFDADGIRIDDEPITGKGKHILRTYFEVAYTLKNSKFKPSVSYELYQDAGKGLSYNKSRYTLAMDYRIDGKRLLNLFYRYIEAVEKEELDGHVIGIGYKFRL